MKERLVLALSVLLLAILIAGVGTYVSYGHLIGSLIESILVTGVVIGVPGLLVVFVLVIYWKENGK